MVHYRFNDSSSHLAGSKRQWLWKSS